MATSRQMLGREMGRGLQSRADLALLARRRLLRRGDDRRLDGFGRRRRPRFRWRCSPARARPRCRRRRSSRTTPGARRRRRSCSTRSTPRRRSRPSPTRSRRCRRPRCSRDPTEVAGLRRTARRAVLVARRRPARFRWPSAPRAGSAIARLSPPRASGGRSAARVIRRWRWPSSACRRRDALRRHADRRLRRCGSNGVGRSVDDGAFAFRGGGHPRRPGAQAQRGQRTRSARDRAVGGRRRHGRPRRRRRREPRRRRRAGDARAERLRPRRCSREFEADRRVNAELRALARARDAAVIGTTLVALLFHDPFRLRLVRRQPRLSVARRRAFAGLARPFRGAGTHRSRRARPRGGEVLAAPQRGDPRARRDG